MEYNKIIPFIRVNGSNFDLFISSVSAKDTEGNNYKPLLMSDVAIKESIDLLGDNKLKISNINLALSNSKYLGKRISDDLDNYVINASVIIYFYNSVLTQNSVDLTDDLIVFRGKVSDYKFDDLKLNFDCESAINKLWTTTIPNPNLVSDGGSNIGDAPNVPDKFKNKPLPAVYGHVIKSPLISYMDDGKWNLAYDSKSILGHPFLFEGHSSMLSSVANVVYMKIDSTYYPLNHFIPGNNPADSDYQYVDVIENGMNNTLYLTSTYMNSLESFEGIKVTIIRKILENDAYVERQHLISSYDDSAHMTSTALRLYNEDTQYSTIGYPNMLLSGFLTEQCSDLPVTDPHFVGFETLSTNTSYSYTECDGLTDHTGILSKYRSYTKIPPYYNDGEFNTFIQLYTWDLGANKSYAFIDLPLEPLNHQFPCETYFYIRAVSRFHGDGNNYEGSSEVADVFEYSGMFIRGANGDEPNHIPSQDRNFDMGFNWNNPDDWQHPTKFFNDTLSDKNFAEQGALYTEGYINAHGGSGPYDDENTSTKKMMYIYGNLGSRESETLSESYQGSARIRYDFWDVTDKYTSVRFGKPRLDYHFVLPGLDKTNETHIDSILLHDISVLQSITIPIEKQSDLEFFGNAKGRDVGDAQLYRNPALIMKHLLNEECGYSDEFINVDSFEQAKEDTQFEYLDFSIVDPIKGNKLFEEMTRDIPYFASFRKGKFDLVNIKDEYSESDYNNAVLISSNNILKYQFQRTDRNKIYQKVIMKYYYDYGEENYLKQHQFGVDSVENNYYNDDYYAYYGIDINEFTGKYDQNILQLENKYIRDTATAQKYAKKIFYWMNNDHLTIDLELPTYKYPDMAIGSTIKFDELLDGVKPFNIDYRILQAPAKTLRYPIFMVNSISKTSEKIKIKAIQLHGLHHNHNMYTESFYNFWLDTQPLSVSMSINPETLELEHTQSVIYGCMDENYADYNPDANVNTGCFIPKVYGCTNPAYQEYNPDATVDDGSCQIPNRLIQNVIPHGRCGILSYTDMAGTFWFNKDEFLNSGPHYPSLYFKDFITKEGNTIINDGDCFKSNYHMEHLYSNIINETNGTNTLTDYHYGFFITLANSSFEKLTEWDTIHSSGPILGYIDESNGIDLTRPADFREHLKIKKIRYKTFPTATMKQELMELTTGGLFYDVISNMPEEITLYDSEADDWNIDMSAGSIAWAEFDNSWCKVYQKYQRNWDGSEYYHSMQHFSFIKQGVIDGSNAPEKEYLTEISNIADNIQEFYQTYNPNWHYRSKIIVDYEIISPNQDSTFSNSTMFTIPKYSQVALSDNVAGDVNFDGNADVVDVIQMCEHVLNGNVLDNIQLSVADVNDDGRVDISDVITVVETILQGDE